MSEYDSLNTMLALNMAIVSIHRILTVHDRAMLEWEYSNIINRLALGNIEDDPEMTGLYRELMDFIIGRELHDEEKDMLRAARDKREQEAWYSTMSSTQSGGLFGQLKGKFITWVSKYTGRNFITSYYGKEYACTAENLKISRETDLRLWQLTKADIESCHKLRKKLFDASWVLLRKYKLSDSCVLAPEHLTAFFAAANEGNPKKRLDMLKFIERHFKVYPPYWFLCAQTAYEAGMDQDADKYLDSFEKIWRPVLRNDPYRLEAAKYRIREIGKGGVISEDKEAEIRMFLEIIEENTTPDDWSNNLFASMVHFALGDSEESIKLLKGNILYGHEVEISGAVLSQLEAGKFDAAKLTAGLHYLFEADLNKLTPEEVKRLAEHGDAGAQNRLGDFYYFGSGGMRQDYAEAVKWYRKSAEQGYAEGQWNLGCMYSDGEGGLPQNYTEAVKWYRKAAEQGNAWGQYSLGCMYSNGEGGLPQNKTEAVRLYRLSAEQGNAWAQNSLGVMYECGEGGLPQNKTEAVRLYRLSAEQGNALAQFNLGVMYEYGKGGLPQNYTEAVRLYRLSAEQGNALAQFNLGVMYYNGEGGLPKDYTEAVKWYRKAAEQGNAPAQSNLGAMYEYGEGGLPKDYTEAVKWYRKAAEQGNAPAQFNLGDMYEYGKGVAKDIAKALHWYTKAASQGQEQAKQALLRLKN